MAGKGEVFDWDGVEQTVTTPDGVSYLGASVPRTSFDHVTVADYTIIANKLVAVSEANLASATVVPALYVVVKVGIVDSDGALSEAAHGSAPPRLRDVAAARRFSRTVARCAPDRVSPG